MNFLLWIVLGALAGWIASIIMRTDGQQGWFMNIIMGIVGAFAGGLVMNMLGQPGVTGFDLYSILVAIGGAALLIWLSRTFMYR